MPSVQFLDDAPASAPDKPSSGSVTFDDEQHSSSEPKVTFDDAPKSNEDLRKEFEAQEAQSVWERAKGLPGKALEGAKAAVEPFIQTPAEMGEASAQPDFGNRLLSTVTRGKVKALRGLADFAGGAVTHAYENAVDHPVATVLNGLGAPIKMTGQALDYLGLNPLAGDKEQRWQEYQKHYFRKLADAENANAPTTPLERAATTLVEPFSNIAEQAAGGEAEPLPNTTEALSTALQLAVPEAGLGATAKVGKAVDAALQAARVEKGVELAGKGAQGLGKGMEFAGNLPETIAHKATQALLGEEAGSAAEKATKVAGIASLPGVVAEHALDPLHLGKAKVVANAGKGLQDVGQVAEAMASAPKDSIWGRAHAVATGEDAPAWMKTFLSNRLVKAGTEAAGIGKDLVKGAAGGAGIGLAYGGMTGQTPEEMAESVGGGAALGAGAHAVKIPGTGNRNILARTADASAALFKQHLQDGVSPETLKSVPDSAWTMAAAIEQYPGLNAKVRFVSPDVFANLKTTDGSPLTDPGAGGVWDRSRQTIWLNAESKRGVPMTLLHEAAHPIFDAAVMKQPEIGRAIDQGLAEKGQTIDDLKRTYVEALMTKELPSMDAQTKAAAVQNRINAFDAAFPDNIWIHSEALAENFVNSFGTKEVLNLDRTVADVMRNALKNVFGGQETTKGFFNEFSNVVKSPELTKLSRGLLKSMRDHKPGLDVLGGEEKQVPLTPEMFGKRPEAPLHEITNADGTVEKGNDFVVASPDGIKPRSFVAMRRIIKNRIAAVRSLFDTKTVLPLGSDNDVMALRRTRSGGEEISGKRLPAAFDSLSVYSKDTKNMTKVIQDAIDTGKTVGSWVHQVASGTLKKTWAAVARGTKGAFTAKYHDYQPYGWLVDKQGNVLVRVFDRQALSAKLADWANRKGITSLEQWGGDQGKAMQDITTYLDNHAKGLKGEENGIGPEKANVINALLAGRNAEFADNNPMREHLKGGDRQGIVRSLRLDRIETIEPSQQKGIPRPEYGKLVQNFSPEAEGLTKMSPDDYRDFISKFKGPNGNGQSGWSSDLGSKIKTADELNHLRTLHQQMGEQSKAALAKGDWDNATVWASKAQAMREAFEAATNKTLDGKPSTTEEFINKHFNPDFKSPMADKSPEGTVSAIASSAAETVKANQQFSPDKKEKPHAVGGTIPVLHFSDSATPLKTVDPKFMRMSTVGKYWEPKPSRSFFFVQGSSLEEHNTKFANRDAYVANIDGRKIYDATGKDPLGFFETWPIAREKQIIAAGYKGVLISANGGKDKVIISYEPVKVKPSTEKTGTGSFSPDEADEHWFHRSGEPGYNAPEPEKGKDLAPAGVTAHYWLSPAGNFYNAERYHFGWAQEHIVGDASDAVQRMQRNGWVRVNADGTDTADGTYIEGKPNAAQKAALEDLGFHREQAILDDSGRVAVESTKEFYKPIGPFSPDQSDTAEKNTLDATPDVSEDKGMSKKFAGYGSRITAILKAKEETKPASLGVTFSVARGREVKTGFSASPFPDMSQPVEPDAFNKQVIADFIKKHLGLLNKPETALGIWDDSKGDSKKIWLDIVATTASKAFAEYLGKKYNQYGVGNLDEYVAGRDGYIPTGGNGVAPEGMLPANERLNADTKSYADSIHEPVIKGTVTPGVPEAGALGRMRSPEEADKLSMQHVIDSPDMDGYAKAVVAHFKTVPGFRDISTKDTHAALKEISSRMQENLEFWYHKASPEERAQWKQWYDIVNHMSKHWGEDFGVDPHVVAAINAKFSPQTAWNDNVTLTRRFLDTMKEDPAVTEKDKTALTAVMADRLKKKNARSVDENKHLAASVADIKVGAKISELNDLQAGLVIRIHNELQGPLLTHDHNIEPVGGEVGWNVDWPTLEGMVSVYRNPSRVNVNKWLGRNHKVRSFYNNHVAPESPNWTTVDTHAIAAANMLPLGSTDNEVKKGFGGISHKGSGYRGTYFVYQDAYEKAAAKLGVLPHELQSIVWEKARQALTPERKRALQDDMSSIKQVHKLREAGRLTPEQARESVLDIYKEKEQQQPEEKSNEPESEDPF